jgi:hypothetical protein
MKTMTRILGTVAVLAVVALVAAPANAGCLPNKTLTGWTGSAFGYNYVTLPGGQDNASVVGRFWQTGNRALANEGQFNDSFWLRPYPAAGPDQYYILGELGDAAVFGCPTGSMPRTVDTASGHNLTINVPENPPAVFDIGQFGDNLSFGSKPRPQVASSARNGTNVDLQVNVAGQTGGLYGGGAVAVTLGYRIVSATGSSDPGSSAALYAPGPTVTPGTPAPFVADCTNPAVDRWIAVQSIVDGVPADTVGPRTRINCNPAMADPDFKHIDRPGRPNPRSGR